MAQKQATPRDIPARVKQDTKKPGKPIQGFRGRGARREQQMRCRNAFLNARQQTFKIREPAFEQGSRGRIFAIDRRQIALRP